MAESNVNNENADKKPEENNNEELAKQIPTVTPDEDNLEPVPDPKIKEDD